MNNENQRPSTSQRGKAPKAGKGVGRKPGRKTSVIGVRIPDEFLEKHPEVNTDWIKSVILLHLNIEGF